MAAVLFAHQGGWDEALLVIGPLAVIGGALFLADRRLRRRLGDDASDDGDLETPARPIRDGDR